MMPKIRLAVILGGNSSEREISLATGKEIIKHLDHDKYLVSVYDPINDLDRLRLDSKNKNIDLCFLALHGRGGEDGTIQRWLDDLNIPYTGSNSKVSALCIDKYKCKQTLQPLANFITPKALLIDPRDWKDQSSRILTQINQYLNWPMVIKPNIGGSSLGVFITHNLIELKKAFNNILEFNEQILIEECVTGTELSIPVLNQQAFPIIEIKPKNNFFDYQSKYEAGYCSEIVPANLTPETTVALQKQAVKIHQFLNCSGLTRSDFILYKDKLYFLEINTIPGMTKNSLCPKSASSMGMSFSCLLDQIISSA